jgi:chromosomal replication initiation ATPase DnaA
MNVLVNAAGERRGSRRLQADSNAAFIEALVASAFRIPRVELKGAARGPANVAFARQVGMYLLHTSLNMSLSAAGRFYGRDRTTAAHACRVVEDRREMRCVDTLVDCLERSILLWHSSSSLGAWI